MNKHLLGLFLVCLSISALTGFELIQVFGPAAPSRNTVITPGMTQSCDFTAYKDGSTYMTWKGIGGDNLDTGSTSASTEYQAALNQGGTLCFTSGTYDFGIGQVAPVGMSSILPSGLPGGVGLILPSKQAIYCIGWNAILTTTAAVSGSNDYFSMFVNKDISTNDAQLIIQGCTINLPAPTQTGTGLAAWDDGIVLAGAHDSLIRDLQITNGDVELYPNTASINHANVLSVGQNFNNLIQNVVENSQTGNTALFQAVNSTITNSIINRSWDDGFIIASAGLNNKITHNNIFGQSVVANKGALTAAAYIQSDGAVCAHPATACMSNNVIVGNTIYNVTGFNSGGQNGIEVLYGQNNVISDNIIHGNVGNGIKLENANNTIINGDFVYANKKEGVAIVNSASNTNYYDFTISNTYIYDNDLGGVQNAGIFISPTSTAQLNNIIISNNLIFDDQPVHTQTYAVSVCGSGLVSLNLFIEGNSVSRSPNMYNQGCGSTVIPIIINNLGYNPQPISSVTAGASPFTTTVSFYPQQIQITTLAGMTGWTCRGDTMINAVNQISPLLAPSQTCILTWTTTAPVFEILPQ